MISSSFIVYTIHITLYLVFLSRDTSPSTHNAVFSIFVVWCYG